MQPTLAITVPCAGMIYLNGRFAGEASPDAQLLAPVPPFGAIYLEYHPLEPGFDALSRKLVMSSGAPLADSLSEDVYALCWPGGVTEVELAPGRRFRETEEPLTLDGVPCRILRGEKTRIELGGQSWPLPQDALAPRLQRMRTCAALTGTAGETVYALLLSPDFTRQIGFLKADRLEFEPDGTLRALTLRRDVAGHAILERWQPDPAGLNLLSSESCWEDGAPRLPATPEETARAAVEAALLERYDEADGYLAPALRARTTLDGIGEACSMCLAMKYPVPGGRPCVGLLRAETGSLAVVDPLYYQAQFIDGRWMLTDLNIES